MFNNQYMNQLKNIYSMIKNSPNPQVMLNSMLQNSPYTSAISNLLKTNGSLEEIARSMAQQQKIDINSIINQFESGL